MKITIKIAFFVLAAFSLNCKGEVGDTQTRFIYWENLTTSQKNEMLISKKVNETAVALYNGKFVLQDNAESTWLLDTLTNISGEKSALYFHLFNKACNEADGALSEMIGRYCQKIIVKSPAYVINYLSKNESLLQKYAEYLGYEMYFKEEGTSTLEYNFDEFKLILSRDLKDDDKLKETLLILYGEIKKIMTDMD